MGRRKNNPALVEELIDNLWNDKYSQSKFEKNYNSLSSSDQSEVSAAIYHMEKDWERRDAIENAWMG